MTSDDNRLLAKTYFSGFVSKSANLVLILPRVTTSDLLLNSFFSPINASYFGTGENSMISKVPFVVVSPLTVVSSSSKAGVDNPVLEPSRTRTPASLPSELLFIFASLARLESVVLNVPKGLFAIAFCSNMWFSSLGVARASTLARSASLKALFPIEKLIYFVLPVVVLNVTGEVAFGSSALASITMSSKLFCSTVLLVTNSVD